MTEQGNSQPEQPRPAAWQRASLADAAEVDFERPIRDVKTANSEVLTDVYRDATQKEGGDENADTPAARVFSMLWSIMGMHFKPREPNEPFGAMMTLADGRRSAIPSDFRGEHLQVIAYMAEQAANRVLRARLSDTCWLLDRKRAGLAAIAISSYAEIVQMVQHKTLAIRFQEADEDPAVSHEVCDLLRRALHIARATGWDKQEALAVRNLASELRKRASAARQAVSMLWFSELDLDFGISDPSEVAEDIERVLNEGAPTRT